MNNSIYIGQTPFEGFDKKAKLERLMIDNELYYKIKDSDSMRPFFMSIVSDSNHWMFISSNGGLTAGRKDCDNAIFPYYTDDKITESVKNTGCRTLILASKENKTYLWEPFAKRYQGVYQTTQNLYKNSIGNKIIFEEINHNLGLAFQYQWASSNNYGFVRKSRITNLDTNEVGVSILDGLQNILPYGLNAELQNNRSNLVDAYKRSELVIDAGLGLFALSAIIVDRAEPSEALKTNVAWSIGFDHPKYLLSNLQIENFKQGADLVTETDIKAEKGAFFVNSEFILNHNEAKNWTIVTNVNQGPSDVVALKKKLITEGNQMQFLLEEDIAQGDNNLTHLVCAADGLQTSADVKSNTRHFSNVMFNIMRGGIFDENYKIEKSDFSSYLKHANHLVYNEAKILVSTLPEEFSLDELKAIAANSINKDFERLCFEYLPLKFSRRHGDPSRPWNRFSINTTSEIDGSKILDYQGNWRDIFQNWEALAHSYPKFINGMIYKFLNATTFEGYNPYRVTKSGFDWETIEANDPWSFIGYWGDHQLIYLLKFLEINESYFPGELDNLLDKSIFVYANVPYKIKAYKDILSNPKDTIDFDYELHDEIVEKRTEIGADGALIHDINGKIHHVNFLEKILATALAKCSNFIPEAGIWLNTQRPEWNDANNALVGNGVSMVTLYYLRRFLKFFEKLLSESKHSEIEVSKELLLYFQSTLEILVEHKIHIEKGFTNANRKDIVDALGQAASNFRNGVYKNGFSNIKEGVYLEDIQVFLHTMLQYLDQSIRVNKRNDSLYHSYNLMTVASEKEISLSYLSEMLEGQVAVLSSGYLSSQESLEVLDALKSSALFREDQYSYLLYPNKKLKGFMVKNVVDSEKVEQSRLLQKLLEDGQNHIIEKDVNGNYHFNGNFNNSKSLLQALNELDAHNYGALREMDKDYLLQVFEDTFNHKAFTGRSGTFFGYEGLGSIYWHMVSKLLYAVQEVVIEAKSKNEKKAIVDRLTEHYYEINEGIGVHKSAQLYGAFPTDPYSHTPMNKGAQQPGMTGQVKEDVLSRLGELGVSVTNGCVTFNPVLLRDEELLKSHTRFQYVTVSGNKNVLNLDKGSLCFTYCQVPVVYNYASEKSISIYFKNGKTEQINGNCLPHELSNSLFNREEQISCLKVNLVK